MFSYKDHNHQVVGPLAAEEIRQLIGSGGVSRFTLLRAEGTEFWQPAMKFDEFRGLFERIAELEALDHSGSSPAPPRASGGNAIDVSASVTSDASTEPAPGNATNHAEAGPTETASNSTAPDAEPPRGAPDGFFMIGGDGQEYGPFTIAQLHEWIRQRRANAATRLRRENQTEYLPLGSWPEFSDVASESGTPPPPVPPSLDSAKADQLASEIIGRGYNLAIGSCFARSWKLYTEHFGLLTGTTAVVLILHTVLHSVPAVGNLASIVLGGVFSAGLSIVFLKAIRRQAPEFADMFVGFQRSFVPLMLASTITFILVSAGLLLCLLPGIYLAVAWLFTYPLVLERSLDFWPAMELSRKVVHERWWELFALALGAVALFTIGLLLFGLGAFFTTPIAFGAIMYAYEDIFGERREG